MTAEGQGRLFLCVCYYLFYIDPSRAAQRVLLYTLSGLLAHAVS